MDNNNKKQQIYTRPNSSSKACLPADSVRKSSDINKPWPRSNTRRHEQPSVPPPQQRNTSKQQAKQARPNVDKRPRPRGLAGTAGDSYSGDDGVSAAGAGLVLESAYGAAGAVAKHAHLDYEQNSVFAPGSKKQNLNHLLNFHYSSRESDHSVGIGVFGRGGGNGAQRQVGAAVGKKHKYNKEQFLQANFQFVIRSSAKPKLTASPDTLIEWNAIEQINIQTTEEPQCPICLYPPIAAKLTRCGHAYCWPCILHYLALSDKTWRKCPICYEAIHIADLKSTAIVQQRSINVDADITFQLMRRKKGSMFIEKFKTAATPISERYPQVSRHDETKLFSKFLIAKRADILDIIERERRELTNGEDASCPEFVFIQQALDLLKERREKLGSIETKEAEEPEENKSVEAVEQQLKIEVAEAIYAEEKKLDSEQTENVANEFALAEAEPKHEVVENNATPLEAITTTTKYYYFYQSEDGQNIYLHPLNVKMLQACYGTLDRAPLVINARILQKEHHSMDEEHRRKFTCLAHLPLTCQFAVVEVDLQPPTVTGGILKLFKDDLFFRKKERQRREREEHKREKQINEINDRQMGKLIASTANLNLSSSHEFPTCGFEESLLSASTQQSVPIATPNRHASYSAVAVVGESPQKELWPTLSSPSAASAWSSNNRYQELSTWGKSQPMGAALTAGNRRAPSDRSSESDSLLGADTDADIMLSPTFTTLSDVLAEAMSQKQKCLSVTGGGGGSKKNKKTKKMLPLFTTGMNYNGN